MSVQFRWTLVLVEPASIFIRIFFFLASHRSSFGTLLCKVFCPSILSKSVNVQWGRMPIILAFMFSKYFSRYAALVTLRILSERVLSIELRNLNHITKIQVHSNAWQTTGSLGQRCTIQVAWSTTPNAFSMIFVVLSLRKFVYNSTCTRQKAPDKNKFHRPLHSGGSEYRK